MYDQLEEKNSFYFYKITNKIFRYLQNKRMISDDACEAWVMLVKSGSIPACFLYAFLAMNLVTFENCFTNVLIVFNSN